MNLFPPRFYVLSAASLCVACVVAGSAYSKSTSRSGAQIAPGQEIVSLRTSHSRTFSAKGGVRRSVIYQEPVNYRDGGKWKRIDNALVRTGEHGYAYENRANRYRIGVPANHGSKAIRIARGDDWIDLELERAHGAPSVDGNAATYRVSRGVTVTYVAESSGIEAKLTLENARVPDTYRFVLETSKGLRLKSGDDGIVVIDSHGQVRFSIPVPSAVDSSGETTQCDFTVEYRRQRYVVSLRLDRDWLRANERTYPVEIDQTISVAAEPERFTVDCLIQSRGPKNKSFCNNPVLAVGSHGKDQTRTLLRFDVDGSLPQGVDIAGARIGLYKWWQTGRKAVTVDVHALTKPFTNAATWKRYDTGHFWSTSGGDYIDSSLATANSDAKMDFEWWDFTDLQTIQQITDGSAANNGFLLKQQDEKVKGFQAFLSSEYWKPSLQPRLEITYKPVDDAMPSAPVLDETTTTPFVDATSFLYTGDDPIQAGVADGTIERTRAAVIRGKVTTRGGDPLPGVSVSVLGHPEFGQTMSRSDGNIYMAVNGGGQLTLVLEKEGYLEAQRHVDVPWQDYAWIDDVALVPLDSTVSTVNLANGTQQVVRGSQVTDSAGTRQATLIFPAGTTAAMNMPDGSSQPLENLSVRITEYTVGTSGPQSMPAELPASTAYTYAIEYSVDEATAAGAGAVEFDRPVVSYTENFIDFKVGLSVPVGYYDRAEGRWIGQKDGRVVKVLSVTGGLAELDVDGSGRAADSDALAELGVTDAERRELAALYQAGESLWRVPISHFSPYDYNYGSALPNGARYPHQPGPESGAPGDDPCTESGSIIGCENQTLGEAVGIAGTPYSLHYQSDRVPGRSASNTFTFSLTGDTIPAPLKRVDLIVEIAGERITRSYAPAPNLTYTYTWDRKDCFGRLVQGSQRITARIGYVYELRYVTPAGDLFDDNGAVVTRILDRSWDLPSGDEEYTQTVGREMTLWQVVRGSVASPIGVFDAHGLGLGGWTIDAQYSYDPVSRMVRGGDGSQWSARSLPTEMSTPSFKEWYCDDGGGGGEILNSVTSTALKLVGGAFSALGSSRVSASANETTGSPPGDNCSLQSNASFHNASGVSSGPDGSVFVAETSYRTISRVGADGIIETVAGTGEAPDDPVDVGDGGPAVDARLSNPTDMAVGPDGSLYIADYDANRIRKIAPDGLISTIAGGPNDACEWDDDPIWYTGQPAAETWLCHPSHIAVGHDGSVYFASHSQYISRIGTDGSLTLVAGDGSGTETGDGGPAWAANTYYQVKDIAVGPEGGIYFIDGHGAVRRITPEGVVSSVTAPACHTNCPSWDGASTPAIDTPTQAVGIAFDGEGGLIVAEGYRILVVSPRETIKLVASIYNTGEWRRAFTGVAVSPSGTAYVVNGRGEMKRIDSPLPGYSAKDETVASRDGQLLLDFDETGRHLQTRDALTGATLVSFSYDSAGRLIGLTDGDGDTTEIERNAAGVPTAIVAPHGQRTTLQLDANGYLSKITNPANESVSFDTNGDGLLRSITDPKGNSSRFTYDALGLLVKDENAVGGSRTLARVDDAEGFEVSTTTALGRTSRHRIKMDDYHTTGRKVTNPDGTSNELSIDWYGKRTLSDSDGTTLVANPGSDPRYGLQAPYAADTALTTPSGRTIETTKTQSAEVPDASDPFSAQLSWQLNLGGTFSTTFDGWDDSFTSTSAEGRTTSTYVDAQRRPFFEQMSDLEPVGSSYDEHGRLVERTQGSRSWRFAYDDAGNLASVTDPLDQVESYEYDLAGRLTRQTLSDGHAIDYTYDANGNLTSITPPGRQPSSFSYDAVDRPLTLTQPDAGGGTSETGYSWDKDGDLTGITRPDGSTIDYGYDSAGRLKTIDWSAGRTTYRYDTTSGKLTSISGPGATLNFSYDGPLPLTETLVSPVDGHIEWDYDNQLRVSSETVNGSKVSYQYDKDGLLTKAGALTLQPNPANGLIDGLSLDDVATTYEHDGYGARTKATTAFSGQPLLQLAYSYDDLGRLSTKTDTTPQGSHDFVYGYDEAGHLVEVKQDGAVVESYAYDANGNRTSATRSDGVTLNASYDARDRLTSFGSNTYSYSANGDLASVTNTESGETTTFDFDSLGELEGATLPDGTKVSYLYDPLGNRIGKRVDGRLVQGFVYGEGSSPVAEEDADGTKTLFVYASSAVTPDYMVRGGVSYRIVSDERDSPRLIVNSSTGEIAQELDYDSYGRVTKDTNPGFQPFGFAGGLYDQDTGLTHFGARDYDAETGRFVSEDPLDFSGGDTNLYAYAWGDPVNVVDPAGLGGWGIVSGVWDTVNAPFDYAAGGINWIGRETGATYYANRAAAAWAEVATDPSSPWWAKGAATVMGSFASLAACDNLGATTLTLATAGVGFWGGAAVNARRGVVLYRAVGDGEAADIAEYGAYRIAGNSARHGKYFYPTKAQAQAFVDRGWATSVTSARFPRSVLDGVEVLDLPGEGGLAYYVPGRFFPYGPVRFHG